MKNYRTYRYHPFITEWLRDVEQGKVHACKEQKQLMPLVRKVLDDPNVKFDPYHPEEYARITEKYFFKLMPDQKFYAALILGLTYKDTGLLVFDQIFLMAGRGWGKNGFISSLAFYFTTSNYKVKNYNVDIVATSEDQAKTSYEDIYNVIEELGEKGKRIYDYNLKKIKNRKYKSTIRYKTSNAKTKDGGRPGCVIFDEIHAYENYDQIKVFTGGLGKVPFPRRIYITTDGEIRDGVIDDYKERAARILDGEEEHNGFLPIIMKLDNLQEVGKENLWDKANQRINYDATLKNEIKTEYLEMLSNESLKEAFITKRMNIPYISQVKTVCTREDLMFACKNHEWIDLREKTCIGSIDFADLRDFASAGLRWKIGGKTYFKQHSWIHEKSLELTNYNINIRECVEKGWVTIVKKDEHLTIPPSLIAEWFLQKADEGIYISKIKGDSFRMNALKETFEKMGLPEIEEVRSGSYSHNKTAPIIDTIFANQTIVLEDDKLMRWYIWNTKREVDKKGNVTYKKIEPVKRKTDGFFCLLHSLIDDDLEESSELISYDPIIL